MPDGFGVGASDQAARMARAHLQMLATLQRSLSLKKQEHFPTTIRRSVLGSRKVLPARAVELARLCLELADAMPHAAQDEEKRARTRLQEGASTCFDDAAGNG